MEEGEASVNQLVRDPLDNQQKEKSQFEQALKNHEKLLEKYRVEVYNNRPGLWRLLQLERIITQFIDLLNDDKYNTLYHDVNIVGKTFTSFLEWKQRLTDELISKYKGLLGSVSIRAGQYSNGQIDSKDLYNSPDLNENEKKTINLSQQREISERSQMRARQIVTNFENHIENIVRQEKRNSTSKSIKMILDEALIKYAQSAAKANWGQTEKSVLRALITIGKGVTPRKYGGQLVRQFKQRN